MMYNLRFKPIRSMFAALIAIWAIPSISCAQNSDASQSQSPLPTSVPNPETYSTQHSQTSAEQDDGSPDALSSKSTPSQSVSDKKLSTFHRNTDDIPNLILESNTVKESRTSDKSPSDVFSKQTDLRTLLSQDHGLDFSLAYHYLFQNIDNSGGSLSGSGGQAELNFTWTAFGRSGSRSKGVFGGKIESRHKVFSPNDPQSLAPRAGSIWTAASGFGVTDLAASQLWYEHHLERDKTLVRVGKMSPFTMFDYYRYKSTRSSFLGQIQTFNPAIPFPPSSLGVTVGTLLPNGFYAEAGVFDANGTPGKSGFKTLFDQGETLKIADIGWTPDFKLGGDSGSNDVHLTVWQVDRRELSGIPEGWGATASAQTNIGNVVPFFRYGYADGGATQLEHFVSAGFGVEGVFGHSDDVIATSFGWGRPSNPAFRDQYSMELYYRLQLTPNLALTPNFQYIRDPATNPTANSLSVLSIRARVTL